MAQQKLVPPAPKLAADAPNAGSDSSREDDVAVGYCHPPKHTRFEPGRSGNPRGRPVGSRNGKTMVEQVFNKPVTIREGQKTRKVPTYEAMLEAHTQKAIMGDARSANLMFNVANQAGFLTKPETGTFTPLPADDIAILADFVRRYSDIANRHAQPHSENGHGSQ